MAKIKNSKDNYQTRAKKTAAAVICTPKSKHASDKDKNFKIDPAWNVTWEKR